MRRGVAWDFTAFGPRAQCTRRQPPSTPTKPRRDNGYCFSCEFQSSLVRKPLIIRLRNDSIAIQDFVQRHNFSGAYSERIALLAPASPPRTLFHGGAPRRRNRSGARTATSNRRVDSITRGGRHKSRGLTPTWQLLSPFIRKTTLMAPRFVHLYG
ncbi:hypothetical protein EVAR_75676_1 [Eumeta japonica]|uniref:Uncharacterized protein n=1 Tax=Eumeta variegata TaxID=151549 RepID=A0A4C1U0X7_EUMVA|nr:hypothetical protein EVAR_75676_1 [Eumeta japonica]